MSSSNTASTEQSWSRLFDWILRVNGLNFTLHICLLFCTTWLPHMFLLGSATSILFFSYFFFFFFWLFLIVRKKKMQIQIMWFSYVFHMSCCIRLCHFYQRRLTESAGTYHRNKNISAWKKKKWTGLDNTKAVPFLSSFFLPALTFCWLTVLQYNWIIEHRMVAYIFKLCPKWEIKGLNPAQHWSMSFRTDWESISLCSGGWSSWALQFAHLCFQRDFICSRQLCWAL